MKRFKSFAWPYQIWSIGFIILPMLLIIYYGFTRPEMGLTLENFSRFFTSSALNTLWRSLKLAALASLICLLLGYPIAYAIAQTGSRYRSTALLLIVIPMWMNFLLRTYSWVTILSRKGILNQFLTGMGLEPLDLLYTEFAVLLGMVYNFLPFMVLPIYTILEKMDPSLQEAAADLGAGPWTVFGKVTLPLSWPGIATGLSMVFIPALSTFEITALLGGNKSNLIGNVIEQQFTVVGDWHYGSALSLILMIFLVISILFMDKSPNEERSRESKANQILSQAGIPAEVDHE